MSGFLEFREVHSNVFLSPSEYKDFQSKFPDFYPDFNPKKIKPKTLDEIAFLGLKVDDKDIFPYKTIPYGDMIIEAFTLGQYRYIKTYSGTFFKKLNNRVIRPIPFEVYEDKKPYKKVFRSFLRFPQAGLTRGSKRSFSDRVETQKNKLDEIQNKYKDGVK